jgi:methylmalonyl-CoA/ethylmalonyl-CoA epimerase
MDYLVPLSMAATRGHQDRGAARRESTNRPFLHHVGFVVPSIAKVGTRFARSIAAEWDQRIIHDPLQKVSVAFLRPSSLEATQVELVEPLGEDSPVTAFLKTGGGLHHLCYEVDDLDAQLRKMRAERSMIAKPSLPAVAFQERRIAWVLTPERLLIEYLERDKART